MHPNSAFKRRWDYLTSLLAVAVVFAPECRAFAGWCLGLEEPRRPPADGPDAGLVAALVNVWFLCDVLLNFVTGYVDGAGVLVMSKRRIAIRYCQTYFLLDIWCALPFDRLVLPYLPVVEDLTTIVGGFLSTSAGFHEVERDLVSTYGPEAQRLANVINRLTQ